MRKLIITAALLAGVCSPAFAWNDINNGNGSVNGYNQGQYDQMQEGIQRQWQNSQPSYNPYAPYPNPYGQNDNDDN